MDKQNNIKLKNRFQSTLSSPLQDHIVKERLAWVEIDIRKFRDNFLHLRKFVHPDVKIMAVIKANAYGHGIVRIAKELQHLKVDYFAVTCIAEAKQLREARIITPILLIGYTDPASVSLALDYQLTISIKDEEVLKEIAKEAKKRNIIANIHVNVDTGMHFYGVTPDKAIPLILNTQLYKHIFLEGIFSHFADAEAEDLTYSYQQIAAFNYILDEVKKTGITPPLIHMANGAALVRMPESHFTMVRPGTFLYGQQTGEQLKEHIPNQILSFKTQITHIRTLHEGESVGYGQSFVAKGKTVIASIPVGYADGFHRSWTSWGYVLVRGKKAPIILQPAMDQTAIDVTKIPDIAVGDEVVLIGKQKKKMITLNELSQKMNCTNYEILSGITDRVTRIYKN
ncbi:MAG: alanine racemase [Candidatus Levyibacteriota bacterium]